LTVWPTLSLPKTALMSISLVESNGRTGAIATSLRSVEA
jgi:hypothetical protein